MPEDRDVRIAELEQENAKLRRSLDAHDAPSTLRHQVRNSLGLMRAILRRSAETSVNVEDYAAHTEGRFDALLRVQAKLISSQDQGVPLHSLIADELVAHAVREGERATLEGPPVDLGPRSAQLLGLAIHELVVNAIKFGAMTSPAGRISVIWSLPSENALGLAWTETGAPGVVSPTFRGFGVETLETMLRYELDAESQLEFRPEGLRCAIRLPFSKIHQ